MKTNNSITSKKKSKKMFKKQLAKTLKERFIDTVLTLGHNVEIIADDIKKMSKVAAKKITKKLKPAKKVTKKQNAKANKIIAKSVKEQAVMKKKPTVTSVSVEPIVSIKKANKIFEPQIISEEDTSIITNQKKANATKTMIKAVPNNPVKKVKPIAEIKKSK